MSDARSEIAQLGEFGLIERIKQKVSLRNATSFVGIGDDAAAFSQETLYSKSLCL